MNDRCRIADDAQEQVAVLAAAAADAAKAVAALAANAAVQVGVVAAHAAESLAKLAADTAKQVEELARTEHERTPLLYPPEHKAFVQILIDERQERSVRRKKILDYVAGILIVSMILGFIGWLGSAAITTLVKATTAVIAVVKP